MIKLSIIIPTYNCKEYTDELLDCLDKQVTDEVEVIVIDDGSKVAYKTDHEWVTLIRKKNGGPASARNAGLDAATGEYVAFIDGDDLVADNYISALLAKIAEVRFDYCYLSWKTMPGGWQCNVKLKSVEDKFPPFNLCCWNRVYRRDMIGDVRFNELKLIAEDAEFIRDVKEEGRKKAFIEDYMYFYRSNVVDSITKRFAKGELYTKRTVIHYDHITADMTNVLDTAKELNKTGEVIVMTNNNEIPELAQYAMVMKPCTIKGTAFIGEPTSLYTQIDLPIKTQVVIWTDTTYALGGIETFIYSFCRNMCELYDIMVLYNKMDAKQIERLRPYVRVEKINKDKTIICDTVIVNRITDDVPDNVKFKQKVQMVHCCRLIDTWKVPTNADHIVAVSDVVRKSYPQIDESNCNVINNFTYPEKPKRALRLVSGTRLTFEKGKNRMAQLAELLHNSGIPFIWTVFTDKPLNINIDGVVQMKPTLDIKSYMLASDYVVQLSDSEGFCYSIVEALEMGVPVLTTPLDVLPELGFEDGVHGYILPFDMEGIDIKKIIKGVPAFKYNNKNKAKIKQWQKILGDTTPVNDYIYEPQDYEANVIMRVIRPYLDMELNRKIKKEETLTVTRERAEQLIKARVAVELQ